MNMKNLKHLRKAHRKTQKDIADYLGCTVQTVANYENGRRNADYETQLKLAELFGVSLDYLTRGTTEARVHEVSETAPLAVLRALGFQPGPKTVKKPRLGVISCGEPIDSEENFEGYDNVPEDIQCDFTLICEGDSMIGARIRDGDVVYIRQQPTVENGQIAAVLIDGEEKLLKRVLFKPNRIILHAENTAYEPLIFDGEEMNRVTIIGRAVGFTSTL